MSVEGKQNLSETVFSALVGFPLLEKYSTFGWEQPEVAGSHIMRVRSLANHRSLVFAKKKSESSVRNVLEHCRDEGDNCLLTTTPVFCTTQHHIGDGGHPCSALW